VNAEFSAARHLRGTLSAARDVDTNSANSQFFICVASTPWLNGIHSVYGQVVAGMNFIDTIVSTPRDSNDIPLNKIEMFITYVGTNNDIPNAPLLNSPATASFSTNLSRVLKWYTQADGITYHLEVATDSLFTNITKSIETNGNIFNVSGLDSLTKYYWRVKTNNGGHFSEYSDVWSFYVSAVGINDVKDNTSNIYVAPNPAKGIFTVQNLAIGSHLNISNVEGKLVFETICSGNNLQVDLSNKPKGIYFYKAKNMDGIVERGKIVLE